MRPHEETHSYDLEDHFNCVNNEEHEIDLVGHCRDAAYFLINSQEETIGEDNTKDDPIEPWVDGHHLDDPVSNGISY